MICTFNGKTMHWVLGGYGRSLLLRLDSQKTSKAGEVLRFLSLPLSFDNKTTANIMVAPDKNDTQY